ncbi:hypothetical protein SR1949_53730 [Sphaerospermopsis reniformis]|uniref:Uncharacterized protein n=1 Tax=Sphaerospermopsis reniformis TaxID=531300 RepID=A0A480AAA6_9CYAN|nr:hypothetical protein SR1949_53730 [Sphaerospermopsis reniformis]
MIANSDLILGEIFTFPDNVDTNHESVSDQGKRI